MLSDNIWGDCLTQGKILYIEIDNTRFIKYRFCSRLLLKIVVLRIVFKNYCASIVPKITIMFDNIFDTCTFGYKYKK